MYTIQSDITSKNTSINVKKLPAIYGRLNWDALRERWAKITNFERTPVVLDFGCGRYTDHIEHFLLLRVLSTRDMTLSGNRKRKTMKLFPLRLISSFVPMC